MHKITVNTARPYPVIIGKCALSCAAEYVTARRVCIISDSNVWPLYGERLCSLLTAKNIEYCHFTFPAGEKSKNLQTFSEILNFLAENQFCRRDQLLALGGGVTGDLAGFAAASYLRGISYLQIPTTLLAMVDSSVGGKTGIDLPAGKNLCGAFHQPAAVICDTDTLSSLPEEFFRDGCAEVIKYALAYDPALFAYLEQTGPDFDRETVICKCIDWKRKAVEQDEQDHGPRKILNLGHTVGHAIECCSHFEISHGRAVAMGMAILSRATFCPENDRIEAILRRFGLFLPTANSATELHNAILSDKKRQGDTIDLVIPLSIGQCRIQPTPIDKILPLLEEGLKNGHNSASIHPAG